MLKRFIPLALAGPLILATAACSPEQVQMWLDWHAQDPAAAEQWASNECGDLCVHARGGDWDRDGIVEPENPPPTTARATTRSTTSSASGSTSSGSSSGGGGWSVNWDAVARCESGGNWSHGPVTNSYGTFSGGLMIMNSAWRQFGGSGPYAGAASKAEQIAVAERIVDRVGFDRAWQCDAH